MTDKGYRSVRTNSILKNNFIHSIYKNGKIRESRIERIFDSKIENTKYIFSFLKISCKVDDIMKIVETYSYTFD